MTDVRVTPKPWLWKPRIQPIRLIEIHSTRGGSANAMTDYIATCNWMQNANNGSAAQGWGGSCSRILGPDGEMTTVLDDNQMPTYCAGYGGAGTWAIDEYGKAYEWAQPNKDTPYSDAMYRRGAKEIALDCKAYGIPPVFLEIWDQRGSVPAGLVRHDRCENGVKLGKSDPGAQFDEAKFLSYLNAELQEDEMTDPAVTDAIKAAKETLAEHDGRLDTLEGTDTAVKETLLAQAHTDTAVKEVLLEFAARLGKLEQHDAAEADATIQEIRERLEKGD